MLGISSSMTQWLNQGWLCQASPSQNEAKQVSAGLFFWFQPHASPHTPAISKRNDYYRLWPLLVAFFADNILVLIIGRKAFSFCLQWSGSFVATSEIAGFDTRGNRLKSQPLWTMEFGLKRAFSKGKLVRDKNNCKKKNKKIKVWNWNCCFNFAFESCQHLTFSSWMLEDRWSWGRMCKLSQYLQLLKY